MPSGSAFARFRAFASPHLTRTQPLSLHLDWPIMLVVPQLGLPNSRCLLPKGAPHRRDVMESYEETMMPCNPNAVPQG
jgi:hypothetical protein